MSSAGGVHGWTFNDFGWGNLRNIDDWTGSASSAQDDLAVSGSPAVEVGDLVWYDANQNGLQDTNEPGIAGVTVNALDSTGTALATVTTDANGYYLLPSAVAGLVEKVEFDITNADVSALTAAYGITDVSQLSFTSTNEGNDDAIDSDPDATGTASVDFSTLASDTRDLSIDAGLTASGTVSVTKAVTGDAAPAADTEFDFVATVNTPGLSPRTIDFTLADGETWTQDLPAGSTVTTVETDTQSATSTTVDGQTGIQGAITISASEPRTTAFVNDFTAPKVEIGDLVWYDANQNGLQDTNEPGIAGVTVTAVDSTNNTLATATTDTNGNYQFPSTRASLIDKITFDPTNADITGLTATYGITDPAQLSFTPRHQGNDTGVDSDPNSSGVVNPDFTSLTTDASDLTIDAGLIASGTVRVTKAVSGDAAPAAGTKFGFTATINTPGLNPQTIDFTLAAGETWTQDVPAGAAVTTVETNTQDATSTTVDGQAGLQGTTTISASEPKTTAFVNDFKATPPTQVGIGDLVWYDANQNGLQDTNEPGLAGVKVEALDADSDVLATATTDSNGRYLLPNTVALQVKAVRFDTSNADVSPLTAAYGITKASQLSFTAQDQGKDDTVDSDPNAAGKATVDLSALTADSRDLSIDAGLIASGTIKVTKAVTGDAAPAASTKFSFVATINTPGSSPQTSNFTLVGGEAWTKDLPAGTTVTTVETDSQGATGTTVNDQTGTQGTVTISASDPRTTAFVNDFKATKVEIGNFVWYDANQNGRQDTNEPGLAGVKVNALDSDGNTLTTATTDANGAYLLAGTKATLITAVTFDAGNADVTPLTAAYGITAASQLSFTAQDQGKDDTVDSDPNAAGKATVDLSSLTSSAQDLTIDAGLSATSTINVTKTVTGDETPAADTEFGFVATINTPGLDPQSIDFTLVDGETWTKDLPAGTTITTVETDTQDATTTTVDGQRAVQGSATTSASEPRTTAFVNDFTTAVDPIEDGDDDGDDGDDGEDDLAYTGFSALPIWLGLIALGAGTALVLITRRRRA